MSPRSPINRPISAAEIAVIQAALERAPVEARFRNLASDLTGLRVTGRCECGCDSVDFGTQDRTHRAAPIADATGTTAAGGAVGVIVWGREDAVTGLEIYDLGAGDAGLRLPVPDSLRGFGASDA